MLMSVSITSYLHAHLWVLLIEVQATLTPMRCLRTCTTIPLIISTERFLQMLLVSSARVGIVTMAPRRTHVQNTVAPIETASFGESLFKGACRLYAYKWAAGTMNCIRVSRQSEF